MNAAVVYLYYIQFIVHRTGCCAKARVTGTSKRESSDNAILIAVDGGLNRLWRSVA